MSSLDEYITQYNKEGKMSSSISDISGWIQANMIASVLILAVLILIIWWWYSSKEGATSGGPQVMDQGYFVTGPEGYQNRPLGIEGMDGPVIVPTAAQIRNQQILSDLQCGTRKYYDLEASQGAWGFLMDASKGPEGMQPTQLLLSKKLAGY
jgi:hypothetical protein